MQDKSRKKVLPEFLKGLDLQLAYICSMKLCLTNLKWPAPFVLVWFWLMLYPISAVYSQPVVTPDSAVNSNKKIYLLGGGTAVLYTGAIIGLSQLWYADEPRSDFHFFNDNKQWLQLDKAGHVFSAFHAGRFGVDAMKWARAREKPAVWVGGMMGFLLFSPIEILDGYSPDYGASWGDLAANATGSALVIGQHLAWKEIRITPKFSFHSTNFASRRPNVLGSDLKEQILKDYNGQTYWLAFDVKAFLPEESSWPAWLGLAAGYGGSGMVYNDLEFNRAQGFTLYRQYYLAPDINLRGIKTRSKFLRTAFSILDMVHLPLPAVEFSEKKGVHFHPLYF